MLSTFSFVTLFLTVINLLDDIHVGYHFMWDSFLKCRTLVSHNKKVNVREIIKKSVSIPSMFLTCSRNFKVG